MIVVGKARGCIMWQCQWRTHGPEWDRRRPAAHDAPHKLRDLFGCSTRCFSRSDAQV
jgi:hypothetical protein